MTMEMAGRRMRALVRNPGRTAARAGVCLLCAAPRLFGALRPFAPALTAAGLMSGWPGAALLLGTGGALLLSGWDAEALCSLLGCAGAWALSGLLRPVRSEKPGAREVRAGTLALCAALFQLLPLVAAFDGMELAKRLAGAVCAAALAPVLLPGCGLAAGRKRLMPDEQASLLTLCALALAGLQAVPLLGGWLGGAGRFLCLLLGAWLGPAAGAAAGAVSGLSLVVFGGELRYGAYLSACGLLCGSARRAGRPGIGAMLLLSLGLAVLLSGEMGPLALLPCGAGLMLFLLLPTGTEERLRGLFRPRAPRGGTGEAVRRALSEAAGQAARLGQAVHALAQEYACPDETADEGRLMARMRSALCAGCEDYAACWTGERAQAGRLLCQMMCDQITGRSVRFPADLPPDATRHCRRSTQVDRRVRPVLERHLEQRRQEVRRTETRAQLARQLEQVSGALRRLGGRLSNPAGPDEELAGLCAAALERSGIRAEEILVLREGALTIDARLHPGQGWSARAAREAAGALSAELGIPLMACRPEEARDTLRLWQVPPYALSTAMLQAGAEGGADCGDSCLVSALPGGRMLLALSDGMGRGGKARSESRRALKLTETLLRGGMTAGAAASFVNETLLARGEEMFATLDLCLVDLIRGEATFVKLGAARSCVLRDGHMRVVEGGRLPVGIVRGVTPRRETVTLRPGDLLVMLSDGLCDEGRRGDSEWLRAQLVSLSSCTPEEAARRLVMAARARPGGVADDVSVLAARLVEAKKPQVFR